MPTLIVATVGGEPGIHHDHMSELQTVLAGTGAGKSTLINALLGGMTLRFFLGFEALIIVF